MTPYYQDDLVTIYHGDCREVRMTSPVHTRMSQASAPIDAAPGRRSA